MVILEPSAHHGGRAVGDVRRISLSQQLRGKRDSSVAVPNLRYDLPDKTVGADRMGMRLRPAVPFVFALIRHTSATLAGCNGERKDVRL